MGLLTDIEKARAWKRLHSPHPYGSTGALCHKERGIRWVAEEGHSVGMDEEANKAAMVKKMIDRKVIITATTATRVLVGDK